VHAVRASTDALAHAGSRPVNIIQRLVAAHTRAVIAAFAVAAFAGATQLGALRVDSTVDNLMLDDDAQRQRNQHAKVEFSDDELILVGVDVGRPFDADAIRDLHALSVRLASVDGVEEVLDLSTIEDVRSEGDAIDASPLIDIDRIDEERRRS
jgi:predicted RND superfamily exporter protein